ncbi:RING-type E3 ubiquitin-protein ligase PPIL2 [Brevipalpus obovatus]|uniref:RING-type E3 ubiquitin-protein ligase PPIL2 n=1 Tax=Brevipalpus obovatus TaxID=246614 RepID=UPI003D9F7DF1
MGKRQHQKDKLYLTSSEWQHLYGGKLGEADLHRDQLARFRRLPFNCCCLSLQPFEHPCCNDKGYVFEMANIIKFLKKYKKDPIDGTPCDAKSIAKLNFHKNEAGKFHCPVLLKDFNDNSHMVAIRKTGNVFSHEAINQLCIKGKNFRDPLTDEPFERKDIITIQDPLNLEKQNTSLYYHFVNKLRWMDEDEDKDAASKNLNTLDYVTRSTLEELRKSEGKALVIFRQEDKQNKKMKLDKFNAAIYSTGAAAASLTSTIMDPTTHVEAAVLDDQEIIYSRVKSKSYVELLTNFGPLNLELYCVEAPRTCHNFIELCKRKYYDGTIFHRLIKNFVLQGGDPTGTGKGGDSIWNEPFKDEFVGHLTHKSRGWLSMANSGPNTNKSQFFITLKSCPHLDRKHTVFGKVVGGLDTLDKIEKIPTEKNDRPKETIKIVSTNVFVDTFQEAKESLAKDREKEKPIKSRPDKIVDKPQEPSTITVGSLIDLKKLEEDNEKEYSEVSQRKKASKVSTFGDFSSW